MRIFDIMSEYYALLEMIEQAEENPEFNPETGEIIPVEEILKDEIAKLNDEKETKLENLEYLKREIKSNADSLADEIKRLQARKKSFENQVEKLKSLQEYLLQGEKLKTNKFTFSYRKSESIEVEDEDLIPDEFKIITYKIDKTNLKKALKEDEIKGAKIIEKRSLVVRWARN